MPNKNRRRAQKKKAAQADKSNAPAMKQDATPKTNVIPPSETKTETPEDQIKNTMTTTESISPTLEVASLKEALPATQEQQLARRPSRSPIGRSFQCHVNHFELQIRAAAVFQYRVDFTPEIENPSTKRRIMYSQEANSRLGFQFVFDGDAQLYSTRNIHDDSFEVICRNQTFTCSIRMVKTLDIQQLSAQVYNVLCKKILQCLRLTPMGRQYFDPSRSVSIPQHKIELWPGFFTSIGSTMNSATLCVDIAHKILRTDSVWEFMEGERWDKRKINLQLEGQIVLTRYNNRTYRVDSVEWNESPLTKFEAKGRCCTILQYYKTAYDLNIQDRKQPLLRIVDRKRKETIFLVPELCCLTGLTDQMRNNFKVMKELDHHTKVFPNQRFQQVTEFANRVNSSKEVQNALNEWQFSLSNTPMPVEGTNLPTELIATKGKPISAGAKAEWNNQTIFQSVPVNYCLIIYPAKARQEKEELERQLKTYSRKYNVPFIDPKFEEIANDAPTSYTDVIMKFSAVAQFVICLLIRKGQSYHAIKQLCCEQLGIPSQCVMAKSMSNPRRVESISAKIIQQINCKAGGELWRVKIPKQLDGTMIVGIDVCHDTHSDKGRGKRSVVGFCASTNPYYTKYFSTVKFQGVGQEIVDELAECFDAAMDNWYQLNGSFPSNVFVYRDGVGEGQFLEVFHREVPQIKKVLQSKSKQIKLTEVIVQKRIHTRIFNTRTHEIGNVPPGTVVDNGCVSRDSYDFYMVSQNVQQGTATPTHYRIIHDEVGLTSGQMQQLTFKLCHLYYNWAGTIRVPAPCHYAHKIAFLVGQSVHAVPHENLSNLLHFL